MNVLIIINSFRLGGAEKLCYDIAQKLSLQKEVNVYLYSIGKIESNVEQEIFAKLKGSSVRVGSFDKPVKKERLKTILKIKEFCRKKQIDIVHTNGQSPDFLMRCSKIIGNKSKVVVTIHSTTGYSKRHEKLFSAYTDAYTAVSDDALRYARDILKIKQKIEVIDNAIDIPMYVGIEKKNEEFEILSVGRIEPQKDYIKAAQFLAPFLKRHTDVKWLIYGDYLYNIKYCNEFKNQCLKLGILKSVEFRGVVTDPAEIYQHGKIFVLASTFEGFGIAFIEAIMSDHYIFSRKVGVIQEILRYGGVVHDVDNKKSIDFIEDIYEDCNLSNELMINKKIVENLYSLDNMVEKYFKVYKRLLIY